MRGRSDPQITMLAFIDLEERVPTAHLLRAVQTAFFRSLVDVKHGL